MSQEYLLSVFFHFVLAAFWIGGMLFLPLVLLPNIKEHPDRVKLLYATGVRFRNVGWISLVLLIVTGTTNYLTRGLPIDLEFLTESDYGRLLMIKLALFLGMLISGAIHDWYIGKKALDYQNGQSDPKMRKLAQWSGRINLILALAIAYIGIALSRGWY